VAQLDDLQAVVPKSWSAFGFGADARVVAPEAVVRIARELAERLVAAYEAPSV
jgi:hypothetical protein